MKQMDTKHGSDTDLLNIKVDALMEKYPYLKDFFNALEIAPYPKHKTLVMLIESLTTDHLSQFGLDHEALSAQILEFIATMEQCRHKGHGKLEYLVIEAGFDKNQTAEAMGITLFPGEVVSVVGPTGSGKSQLLSDIECLAQGDTPSGRNVLPNGKPMDAQSRFSGEFRLVAQLSQNMNFVMDLTVEAFLQMHAESRLIDNISEKIEQIYQAAVMLAGEPFSLNTAITSLSGGQSRALMIADVAYLSASPVVLIDEIENAGIDRVKAISLLLNKEKIVLLATHDPLLALSCDRRIVIKNGGIADVVKTLDAEKKSAACLSDLDKKLGLLRERVRKGKHLIFDQNFFFDHP
ncbi:ATP-binding cassette domain-containing protein [uncultured Desulfobacter sp.]|uniref:ATP-binding cassette domain-containing protein n=1 Tax=uncultured Desulfobacter sp. TaxID=240139 RepID=UPI002AA73D10|nr:ATP-binding cassette domain-containing protein [uncultured Desulfobacter sp.]